MPSIKITVLALATAVAAVPHYGAHSSAHSRYHSAHAAAKPYPTGGWAGYSNSTGVAQATGTGGSAGDTTIDVTSTSTTTLVKTVLVKPSPIASGASAKAAANEGGQCGPATITVTAKDVVTVTVTPGAGAPASSAAPAASKSMGEGYPVAPSSKVEKPTPAAPSSMVEQPKPTPVAPSSMVEQPKPTPVAPSSKAEEAKPSSAQGSSTPAPSKAPVSGGGYSGTKRGLAYNDVTMCKELTGKFGFAYNWGQAEITDLGGMEFIPMMHRPSESTPEAWLKNVATACNKGTKAVMGFNEPDIAAQANMSPEAACSAWKQYMNPIAANHPDVTIIGPSVSNAGGSEMATAGMGLAWLKSFHDVCPDAIVHATNIHFYDIYQDATIDRFIAQIEKAAEIYGKPVWVTEFGLNPGSASQEQAIKFLNAAMAYMDGSAKVQGYSWFMVGSGENQLVPGSAIASAYSS